jgi:dual-specificity kinase
MDEEGYLKIVQHSWFTKDYYIANILGKGQYGQVVLGYHNNLACAIKIIKAIPKYTAAARREIDTLLSLQSTPNNWCIRLNHHFDYNDHVCMVFDFLQGGTLHDFHRSVHFRPLPTLLIRELARQLFGAVAYVHKMGFIHTDIKPENVMLNRKIHWKDWHVYIHEPILVLIDFGSTVSIDYHHSSLISTQQYRAPEVILGLEWTLHCDCVILPNLVVNWVPSRRTVLGKNIISSKPRS